MKIFALALLLSLPAFSPLPASAQSPAPKAAAAADDVNAPPRSKVAAEPAGAKPWDAWYTITVNRKFPYGYYHETIETKEGRLVYKLHAWKKEEDFINEEQLGAFARAEDLAPLFFNFHSTYRGTERTADGTIQEGKILVVKVAEGGSGDLKEKPLVRVSLRKDTLLSAFFPLWLVRQGARLKPGRAFPFSSVLEDGGDNPNAPFAIASGTVKPLPGGEPRFEVAFRNQKSVWTYDAQGTLLRIETPALRMVTERVTEATARKFLDVGKK